MLCKICKSIDFDLSIGSPEIGGAPHHSTFESLLLSASVQGCELCNIIVDKLSPADKLHHPRDEKVYCNIFNWYEGPTDYFLGSCTILFWSRSDKSYWGVILGILIDESSPLATKNIISGRRAQLSSDTELCYSMTKQWIHNCITNHSSSCPYSQVEILPTRVIDVGDADRMPSLMLTNGGKGVWVALSHCWGRESRFVTDSTNLEERQTQIPIGDLPQTFHDAIIVTRGLGYQYLWIDSLCIIQDSSDDWAYESTKMQDYYSKAIVTISVDDAEGDHIGFLYQPRQAKPEIKVPFRSKSIPAPTHVYIFKDVESTQVDTRVTPLSSRAWTLQEDVLSPRTIHYTETQLIFECQLHKITEMDVTPQGYSDSSQSSAIKRFFLRPESGLQDVMLANEPTLKNYYEPIYRWYNLFEEYFRRILTFEEDRLAAITGLAKEIQRQTGFTYKAGIWMEDLHLGLLWGVHGRGELPVSRKYRAPSWSWAAIDINIWLGQNYHVAFELYLHPRNFRLDSQSKNSAELIECTLETVNSDPFGKILSGHIKLRGLLLPASKWKGKTAPHRTTWRRRVRSHQYGFPGALNRTGYLKPEGADQLICDFDTALDGEDDDGSEDGINQNSTASSSTSSIVVEDDGKIDSYDDWDTSILDRVFLFQIARYHQGSQKGIIYTLMLMLMESSKDCSHSLYRRVGIADVPEVDRLAEEGWEVTEVVIV